MHYFNYYLKTVKQTDKLKYNTKSIKMPIAQAGNAGKPGDALTGQKPDSPRNFWERNLIFLVAFIFMICLANLFTTLFFIYFFLKNLH